MKRADKFKLSGIAFSTLVLVTMAFGQSHPYALLATAVIGQFAAGYCAGRGDEARRGRKG